MTRATVSVGPPAEKDTMMRTGLEGYLSSALAAAATNAHAMTPASAATNRSRLPITSLPDFMTMVTFRRTVPSPDSGCRSLNPDARGFDDLAPFWDLHPDIRCVILGRIDDRLEAERGEALLHIGLPERFGDLAIQEVDDVPRGARRYDHAGERIRLLPRDSRFLHCRHVWDHGRALLGQDDERAQVSRLDLRRNRRQREKRDRGVVGDDRLHRRPGAVERHRHEVEAERQLEQFTGKMRSRTGAGMGVVVF